MTNYENIKDSGLGELKGVLFISAAMRAMRDSKGHIIFVNEPKFAKGDTYD